MQNKPTLRIKKLAPDAVLPRYSHPGDAGMDLFALEDMEVGPGESCMVKTGIAVAVPPGTEAQVRPRSGLALKYRVTVLNSPGTIDEGYRGEVGVILINHGTSPFAVKKGMRVAQMVIKPVLTVEVEETEELGETARGSGGFGSTGET